MKRTRKTFFSCRWPDPRASPGEVVAVTPPCGGQCLDSRQLWFHESLSKADSRGKIWNLFITLGRASCWLGMMTGGPSFSATEIRDEAVPISLRTCTSLPTTHRHAASLLQQRGKRSLTSENDLESIIARYLSAHIYRHEPKWRDSSRNSERFFLQAKSKPVFRTL